MAARCGTKRLAIVALVALDYGMARTANLVPAHDPTRTSKPWYVSIPPKLSANGKRQRRFFATKSAAEGEIQRLKVRKENHGISAKLLDPAQEQQSAAALKLLRDAGLDVQLAQVVGDYISRQDKRSKSLSLAKVWQKYIDAEPRSDRHTRNLQGTLRRFKPLHDRLVIDITVEQIKDVLAGAAVTYKNRMIREAGAVFAFAKLHDWLQNDPFEKIKQGKHKIGERSIYTLAETQALLATAARNDEKLIPYVCIAIFAGLRPDNWQGELARLQWGHVNIAESMITLPASITKTGRKRFVPIEPCLMAWLQWYIERHGIQSGSVCPEIGDPLRDRLRAVFDAAKVKREKDATRHTYASYWLSQFRDEGELALRLGHVGGVKVLHTHYFQNVDRADAEKFWQLTPYAVLGKTKVIPMRATA